MNEDPVAKTVATYENMADDYFRSHSEIGESPLKKSADYFLENLKGNQILDAGCGPGRDAKYFSDCGFKVTGIDLSPRFIEIASQYVTNGNFMLMDMRKIKLPEKSFNGIWACASFMHIPKNEINPVLDGFYRSLDPKGILCVIVKKGSGEKFVKKDYYKGREKFTAFYFPTELRMTLESCNLEVFKMETWQRGDEWISAFAKKIT